MSELVLQMLVFVIITFIALALFGLVYELYLYYTKWKVLTSYLVSEAYISQGLADWSQGGSEEYVN